jgi:hypothetical protein
MYVIYTLCSFQYVHSVVKAGHDTDCGESLDGLACEDYGLMRCDYILVAVYHLLLLSG